MHERREIGFQLRLLGNLIKRDIECSNAKNCRGNMRGVHGWAIGYLYENRNNDVFQKDFEAALSIRGSTSSSILKNLESKNIIERKSVDYDGRLKKIVLTERAIGEHEKIMAEIADREKRLRKGLTEQEIDCFFTVIEKLKKNMEENND